MTYKRSDLIVRASIYTRMHTLKLMNTSRPDAHIVLIVLLVRLLHEISAAHAVHQLERVDWQLAERAEVHLKLVHPAGARLY